jgi:flavin reductase (DIM6/NTAB) family NADH-FMN oxidoreductase RutF
MEIVQAQQFKDGMRRLAASVTILTVGFPDGRRYGMTATAVCSVSAEPPILLCCINRKSNSHQHFLAAERFGVNVLTCDDEELARRFAVAAEPRERFAFGDWDLTETGVPLLRTAAASFLCRKKDAVEMGEHTVFFGEVIEVATPVDSAGTLIYGNGCFGAFHARPK